MADHNSSPTSSSPQINAEDGEEAEEHGENISDLNVSLEGRRYSFITSRQRSVDANSLASSIASAPLDVSGGSTQLKPTGLCKSLTTRQLLTLGSLCLTSIFSATFYSLLAPFFPTEALKKGANPTSIGFIQGCFQAIVFIMSPIYGHYLPQIGPKFMYVAGILVTSSCCMLFGTLSWCPDGTVYVVMCFLVRGFEALGSAAAGTANLAIAGHTFPNSLSTVMGILEASSCVGLMVGPPVGGLLFSAGGFWLPFLVAGSAFFICGVLSSFILPPQVVEKRPDGDGRSKMELVRIPIIPIVGLIVASGQGAIGFLDVSLAGRFEDFHISPAMVGLLFLIPSATVVLLAPLNGTLVDKYKKLGRYIMVVGPIVGGISFLLMGPSPLIASGIPNQLWMVAISLVVAGFGWSAMVVTYQECHQAAKAHGMPDDMTTQGLLSGVYGSFNSLGAFIGPTVGGIALQHLGFGWSATVVAGVLILAALVLATYMSYENCQQNNCKPCCRKDEEQQQLIQN